MTDPASTQPSDNPQHSSSQHSSSQHSSPQHSSPQHSSPQDSSPNGDRLVTVVGATGQQGGAAVTALLAAGYRVRGLTRSTGSPAAQALQARGVQMVATDLTDPASLARAFQGSDAAYVMTTLPSGGDPQQEVEQGRSIADAVAASGTEHLVLSSVGGAERGTGIPHFESKFAVEQHVRSLGIPVTVLRPVFFMENLLGAELVDGEIAVSFPLPDDVAVQMIATADLGRVAAAVVLAPEWYGRALEVGAEARTGSQMAAAFTEALGVPAHYRPLPLEVLAGDEDMTAMFGWFTAPVAYQADVETTRRLDPQLLDLPAWIRTQASTWPRSK